jgi:hypothetical protein
MGIDITFCWHGSASAFSRFRVAVGRAAGIPLPLMDGYYENTAAVLRPALNADWLRPVFDKFIADLPLKWESLKHDPIHRLLRHPDDEGEIRWGHCPALAERLEELIPDIVTRDGDGYRGQNWAEHASVFVVGFRKAYDERVNVRFRPAPADE